MKISRKNIQDCSEIWENSKIYCPQKFPAIRYIENYSKLDRVLQN